MAESSSLWRRRPTAATLVGAVLVILGFFLTSVDWRFLALAALGTFGPGILREMGWVKDKDEFEMRAIQRAGYHAYLATGLTAFVLVGLIRSADGVIEQAGELVSVLLAVLWLTWLLSSLHAYWGPRKTVSRILIIFGSVIAFTSYINVLRLLPVQVGMTYAYANPVIAVFLGWLIISEQITGWTLAGTALVVAGVAGVFNNKE